MTSAVHAATALPHDGAAVGPVTRPISEQERYSSKHSRSQWSRFLFKTARTVVRSRCGRRGAVAMYICGYSWPLLGNHVGRYGTDRNRISWELAEQAGFTPEGAEARFTREVLTPGSHRRRRGLRCCSIQPVFTPDSERGSVNRDFGDEVSCSTSCDGQP